MADNKLSKYKDELNRRKSEEEAIIAQQETLSIKSQEETVSLIDNLNDKNDEDEDKEELKQMDCMQKNLFNGKKNQKNENVDENKYPIFVTTWEDLRTGLLLAYSIGFGKMGTNVHDVSHLNISRDEFMGKALPIISSGGSPGSIDDALDKAFPSQKTYSSFSSFQSTFSAPEESSKDLDESISKSKGLSL